MVFFVNVISICPTLEARSNMDPSDRADADAECDRAQMRNTIGHAVVGTFWVSANLFILFVTLGHTKNIYIRDWR